jgi:hypothetical protein
VAGDVRADDPDGLDSIWVIVDSEIRGEDGGFDRVFSRRYRFIIATGKSVGSQIPMTLRARDIAGFEVTRDTFVVVVP